MSHKILRSEQGLSLLQTAVLLGVAMAVGVAVFQAATTSKKALDKSKLAGDSNTLVDMTISSLRAMLLDTGSEKMDGICRIFTTNMKSGGTGHITLNLPAPGANPGVFDADWSRAFESSKWEEIPDSTSCTHTVYRRCFRPRQDLGVTPEFFAKKPQVTAMLIPVNMRNTGGSSFDPISTPPSSAPNARDSGFVLSVTVETTEPETKLKSTFSSYATLWAGQLTCGFRTPEGRFLYLNPSSIGSGTGNAAMLFSSTNVNSVAAEEPLLVNFKRYENTRSKIVSGNKVVSDYGAGAPVVSSVCHEKKFRCRNNSSSTRSWNPKSIAVEASVRYQANSKIASNSVVAWPELIFKRHDGSGLERPATEIENNYAPLTTSPPYVTIMLNPTNVVLRPTDSEPVCRAACNEGNNYNTNNPYRPGLRFHLRSDYAALEPLSDYMEEMTDTYCNCCTVKQCGRMGYMSRDSCARQAIEPQDSRMPECEVSQAELATPSAGSYLDTVDTSGFTPNSCVAVRPSGASVTFESRSCSESLPSLCFYQGSFRATASLDSGTLTNQSFAASPAACYRLADESLEKEDVDQQLTKQGDTGMIALLAPYTSGANYRLMNAMAAGSFLAPETSAQRQLASTGMTATGGGTYWTALRVDESRFLYAAPPEVNNSFMSNIGYFHEGQGSLRFVSDPNHGYVAGNEMVILHGRKYFGAVAVAATAGTFHPICRNFNTGQIFRAGGTAASPTAAKMTCFNAGGVFVPPLTPQEWSYALQLTAPNSPDFPWPEATGGNNFDTSWIAMNKASGEWQLSGTAADSSDRLNWKGEAVTDTITHRLCRNSSTKRVKVIDKTLDCDTGWSAFGPVKNTDIVWLSKALVALAKARAAGTLDDDDAVDLKPLPPTP